MSPECNSEMTLDEAINTIRRMAAEMERLKAIAQGGLELAEFLNKLVFLSDKDKADARSLLSKFESLASGADLDSDVVRLARAVSKLRDNVEVLPAPQPRHVRVLKRDFDAVLDVADSILGSDSRDNRHLNTAVELAQRWQKRSAVMDQDKKDMLDLEMDALADSILARHGESLK